MLVKPKLYGDVAPLVQALHRVLVNSKLLRMPDEVSRILAHKVLSYTCAELGCVKVCSIVIINATSSKHPPSHGSQTGVLGADSRAAYSGEMSSASVIAPRKSSVEPT